MTTALESDLSPLCKSAHPQRPFLVTVIAFHLYYFRYFAAIMWELCSRRTIFAKHMVQEMEIKKIGEKGVHTEFMSN
jgi:hypothetical protein